MLYNILFLIPNGANGNKEAKWAACLKGFLGSERKQKSRVGMIRSGKKEEGVLSKKIGHQRGDPQVDMLRLLR